MEEKYRKQYSGAYQSLEAVWNVLRLYASQEHPLSVREIYNILKQTEETPPSTRRLERLLTQEAGLINTLFPTLEVCARELPSYSTVDNQLKRLADYGGNGPYELHCVAQKRRYNGEPRFVSYSEVEESSTDEEGRKNNTRRYYYLKGPLSQGAWRFLSDFVRDHPHTTCVQAEQIQGALDLLVQPKPPRAPDRRTPKPDRSEMLAIIEQIDRAIREGKKLLVTVGDYALKRRFGRLVPVLCPGETVELVPDGLVWSGGHYWLTGRGREPAALRVDRLFAAALSDEEITPPEDRQTGLPRTVVRLRCARALLGDVAELLGQKAQYSALTEDGTFEVMVYGDPEGVKSLALRRPDGVEVLEPESLRQDILRTLREGMARYEH